jgi:hypothetical protein
LVLIIVGCALAVFASPVLNHLARPAQPNGPTVDNLLNLIQSYAV